MIEIPFVRKMIYNYIFISKTEKFYAETLLFTTKKEAWDYAIFQLNISTNSNYAIDINEEDMEITAKSENEELFYAVKETYIFKEEEENPF